ncbi:MAG: aldo/keto reductase [Spirochaetia bacterium]
MLYRKIGNSDINASLVGYGAWKAGKEGWSNVQDNETIRAIEFAADNGINYFDTAPIYGFGHSEILVGKALKKRREEVYIATKVGLVWDANKRVAKNLSKESVLKEIDQSLERMGIDYIDLIQIHWNDNKTPMAEVMEAFTRAQEKGKVRHLGVCNLGIGPLRNAVKHADLISSQNLYNMIDRNSEKYLTENLNYHTENEIIPFCKEHRMSLIPYSPLGQGFLSESFHPEEFESRDVRNQNSMFEQNKKQREQLVEKAHSFGVSLSELAIIWLAKQEVIGSIIISSTNQDHIQENILALDKIDKAAYSEI